MFQKIYLHVGLPKTGTSYLQNALDALSRTASLLHTSYPVLNSDEDHARIQSGNGEAIAYQLLAEEVPNFCVQTVTRLTENLLAAADHSKANLLISSEHFSNAEPARMVSLLNLLKTHAISVEVLVFLRPVDRLCHSRYHQEVKRHAESRAYSVSFFEEFCQKLLRQVGFIGNLPCTVHTFDYRSGGLLAVLLGFLGEESSLQVPFMDQTVNRSLTENELSLLCQVNALFKNSELSTRISDRWIYANPQVRSVVANVDRQQVFTALSQLASEQVECAATQVSQAMLDRLLSVDSGDSKGAGNEYLEQASTPQSCPQDLLQMALEEIAKTLGFEEKIGEYTEQLVPTRDVFDPVHYLLLNRDVLAAGVDPVKHFKQFGRNEGRFASFITIPKIFG